MPKNFKKIGKDIETSHKSVELEEVVNKFTPEKKEVVDKYKDVMGTINEGLLEKPDDIELREYKKNLDAKTGELLRYKDEEAREDLNEEVAEKLGEFDENLDRYKEELDWGLDVGPEETPKTTEEIIEAEVYSLTDSVLKDGSIEAYRDDISKLLKDIEKLMPDSSDKELLKDLETELKALEQSEGYFAASSEVIDYLSGADFDEKFLQNSYKKIEKERLKIEGCVPLVADLDSLLVAIKNELVGNKTYELKDEIDERLGEYDCIRYKFDDGQLVISLDREAFDELTPEEQELIEMEIADLRMRQLIKTSEALLPIESREHYKAFYEANIVLNGGNLFKAKALYNDFLKGLIAEGVKSKDELKQIPEARIAISTLKSIALFEHGQAVQRLNAIQRSVLNTPKSHYIAFYEEKFGMTRNEAIKMITAQQEALYLAKMLIEGDNLILNFEDAIAVIEMLDGLDEKKYEQIIHAKPQLTGTGITLEEEFLLNLVGDWNKRTEITRLTRSFRDIGGWEEGGLAYFSSSFGKYHLYEGKYYKSRMSPGESYDDISHMDGVRSVMYQNTIDENGEIDKEAALKMAEEYKEKGLYEAAEQMYDVYFADVYRKYQHGAYDKETFVKNFREDDEKMAEIQEELENIEEYRRKKKLDPLTDEDREMMIASMIEKRWKDAVREQIHTSVTWKRDHSDEPLEEWEKVWLDFNDDLLQIDRDWYEFWRLTSREADRFWENLPVDLVMILASGGSAQLIGRSFEKQIVKKLISKEVAKMTVTEAFEEGGKKLVLRKVGAHTLSMLPESIAFGELMLYSNAMTSGDISVLANWQEHGKAIGHSILTLGTLRGVGYISKPLREMPGVAAKVRGFGTMTVADTMVLTGLNFGFEYAVGGHLMTEDDVSKMILSNAVLSVGLRSSHGLSGWAKGRDITTPVEAPREKMKFIEPVREPVKPETPAEFVPGVMEKMPFRDSMRLKAVQRFLYVQLFLGSLYGGAELVRPASLEKTPITRKADVDASNLSREAYENLSVPEGGKVPIENAEMITCRVEVGNKGEIVINDMNGAKKVDVFKYDQYSLLEKSKSLYGESKEFNSAVDQVNNIRNNLGNLQPYFRFVIHEEDEHFVIDTFIDADGLDTVVNASLQENPDEFLTSIKEINLSDEEIDRKLMESLGLTEEEFAKIFDKENLSDEELEVMAAGWLPLDLWESIAPYLLPIGKSIVSNREYIRDFIFNLGPAILVRYLWRKKHKPSSVWKLVPKKFRWALPILSVPTIYSLTVPVYLPYRFIKHMIERSKGKNKESEVELIPLQDLKLARLEDIVNETRLETGNWGILSKKYTLLQDIFRRTNFDAKSLEKRGPNNKSEVNKLFDGLIKSFYIDLRLSELSATDRSVKSERDYLTKKRNEVVTDLQNSNLNFNKLNINGKTLEGILEFQSLPPAERRAFSSLVELLDLYAKHKGYSRELFELRTKISLGEAPYNAALRFNKGYYTTDTKTFSPGKRRSYNIDNVPNENRDLFKSNQRLIDSHEKLRTRLNELEQGFSGVQGKLLKMLEGPKAKEAGDFVREHWKWFTAGGSIVLALGVLELFGLWVDEEESEATPDSETDSVLDETGQELEEEHEEERRNTYTSDAIEILGVIKSGAVSLESGEEKEGTREQEIGTPAETAEESPNYTVKSEGLFGLPIRKKEETEAESKPVETTESELKPVETDESTEPIKKSESFDPFDGVTIDYPDK